jgi:hypothetical protein
LWPISSIIKGRHKDLCSLIGKYYKYLMFMKFHIPFAIGGGQLEYVEIDKITHLKLHKISGDMGKAATGSTVVSSRHGPPGRVPS